MKKIGKMNELAWVIGIIACGFGVCLCTKADFGLSMIAAPPYILHVTLRDTLPWFTQGTAEYIWQGFLLIVMCIVIGKFRLRYLLTFATAVLSGLTIDFWFLILGGNAPYETMIARIIAFVLGELITSLAIAFVFRTTLPVQIYELLVREIANRFHFDVNKVKQVNDIAMLALSAAMSLILTHGFNGFGIGTIIITLVNAPLIAYFGKWLDRFFTFEPRFPKLSAWLGEGGEDPGVTVDPADGEKS